MGYTYDELLKMGATPTDTAPTQKKKYTYEELTAMGAKPTQPTQTTQPAQPSEDIALGLLIGAAKGAGSTLESGLRSAGQIAGGIGGAISVPIQERRQADLVTQYEQALQDKNPALAKQIYNQINQAGAMSRQAQWLFDNPLLAKAREALTPKTTAEKIGYGGEKILELVYGAGSMAKTALPKETSNIIKLGENLLKSKNAWTRVGGAILKDLPHAAGTILTTLGSSGAGKTGEIKEAKENVTSALIAGGLDLATTAVIQGGKEAIDRYIKDKPAKWINKLINVKKGDLTYGKNPGEQIAKDKIRANSLKSLEEQVTGKINELSNKGKDIISKSKNANATVDLTPTLNSLDESIENAKKGLDSFDPDVRTSAKLTVKKLQELKKNFTDYVLKIGKGGIKTNPKFVPVALANDAKQRLGDVAKWTPEAASYIKDINLAKVKAYGATRQAIENTVPEIIPVNEALSNYISARHALRKVMDAAQQYKEPILSGAPLIKRGVGGLIGYSVWKDWKGAVLGGLLEPYVYQLAQSPSFVTAISSAVKSMSPSDVSTIAKNSPTLWKEIIKQGFIGKATGQY